MAIYKKDRFGNSQAVIGLSDKKGMGYPRGFVKIGSKNYKVEVSSSNKDGIETWVTLTAVTAKKRTNGLI